MKNKEELLGLKAEVEALGKKLGELDSEELEFVTGGQQFIGGIELPIANDGIFVCNKNAGMKVLPTEHNIMGAIRYPDKDEAFVITSETFDQEI